MKHQEIYGTRKLLIYSQITSEQVLGYLEDQLQLFFLVGRRAGGETKKYSLKAELAP